MQSHDFQVGRHGVAHYVSALWIMLIEMLQIGLVKLVVEASLFDLDDIILAEDICNLACA